MGRGAPSRLGQRRVSMVSLQGSVYDGEVTIRWNSRPNLTVSKRQIRLRHQRQTGMKMTFAALVLALILVIIGIPLYYLVFRKYLFGSDSVVPFLDSVFSSSHWRAACSSGFILDCHRFDCFPGKRSGQLTEKECQSRGCCYNVDLELRNNSMDNGPPLCLLPNDYGYYHFEGPKPIVHGYEYVLQRVDFPQRYGDDVPFITLQIIHETTYRLHLKIFDSSNARYEVPEPKLPVHGFSEKVRKADAEEYAFMYNKMSPTEGAQYFKIRRSSTGTVIFDTSKGAIVFSNQFLQLTTLLASKNVYGLGQNGASRLKLDLNWKIYTLFNSDSYPERPSNQYGSHPFYLVMEDDGLSHGVLLFNSNAMEIEMQPTPAITFRTTGGIFDFYFLMGPTPEAVIQQYTEVRCHQYHRQQNCKENVVLDMDVRDNYEMFTLNANGFGHLRNLFKHNESRLSVVIEPGIPSDRRRFRHPYESGLTEQIFVNDTFGSPYQGSSWAGRVVFPDFVSDRVLRWWSQQLQQLHHILPFSGLFLTHNEPTDFSNGTITECLDDNLNHPPFLPHIRSSNLYAMTLCMNANHNLRKTREKHYNLHNLYGHFMAKRTFEALKMIDENTRPLVMSRSSFVGTGRYAGLWLGETESTWEQMRASIPAILRFNMFGIPLVGSDVCGFYQDATEELCFRWMQLGIMYPFSRNHNAIESTRQDPLAFGAMFQSVIRKALQVRYQLLPYLYTLLYSAHLHGGSVARPLFFNFPKDKRTYGIDSQFMWGEALITSPALKKNEHVVKAYFPRGLWFDFHSGRLVADHVLDGAVVEVEAPLDDPQNPFVLHIRGGFIVPLQEPALNTKLA